MNLSPIKNYMSQFLQFTDEEWEMLEQRLSSRTLQKGEFLLKQGKVCNHVSFINSGHFRTYTIVNGEELTQQFAFEGNYVTNYASFLSKTPSTEFIVAMSDAELIDMHRNDMHSGFDISHTWERFGRLIAEYIFLFAWDRNRDMLYLSPEERYVKLMKDRPKVIERIPQRYIASYLGIKPESLSRIRRRMAKN